MSVIRFTRSGPQSKVERRRSPRSPDELSVMRQRIEATRAFLEDSDRSLHLLRQTTRQARGGGAAEE